MSSQRSELETHGPSQGKGSTLQPVLLMPEAWRGQLAGAYMSMGMNLNGDPARWPGAAAAPWRLLTVSHQQSPGKTKPLLSRQQENDLSSNLRPQLAQLHTEGPELPCSPGFPERSHHALPSATYLRLRDTQAPLLHHLPRAWPSGSSAPPPQPCLSSPLSWALLTLSLIHISEPTRPPLISRMPSSA